MSLLWEEGWGSLHSAFNVAAYIQSLSPFYFHSDTSSLILYLVSPSLESLSRSPGRKHPSFSQVEGNAIALELGIQESATRNLLM